MLCPKKDKLEKLWSGQLHGEENKSMLDHMTKCKECTRMWEVWSLLRDTPETMWGVEEGTGRMDEVERIVKNETAREKRHTKIIVSVVLVFILGSAIAIALQIL